MLEGDQFVSPLESDEGFSNFGVIYSQTVEVLLMIWWGLGDKLRQPEVERNLE